ncbi:hypothetical protein KP509_39G006500 [Ceratopteris richardii]|uniref:Cytochrome P450 n=1 Tax=Ceratopteris richardii TaxID=49495 RepID=A0A8T2PXQ8_CERRI|nr:hypothetical protein KP509_39G006500 [Ceratopteris richardii]
MEKSKVKRFPPGPWSWPIVGNMHLLANLPHQVIRDLSRQYGPIIGLRLGQQPAIAVCSPSLAKEVLMTHDSVFGNRPAFKLYDNLLYPGDSGIIFTTLSREWRAHRKLCVMSLMTPKCLQRMEYIRLEEVSNLLGAVYAESDRGVQAISIGTCVARTSARLLMRLLIRLIEQEAASPGIGDLIPVLSWLDLWRIRRVRAIRNRFDVVLSSIIANRMKSMAENSHESYDDLLQSLLRRFVQPNGTTQASMNCSALDALTIEWAIAELLKNPKCLMRLRQEMEDVLGEKKGQLIVEADVKKLRYLTCVIKEVARLHPAAPLLIPRMSSKECEVGGYKIPSKTLTFVNVWAIGRDESIWENALEFRPERFEGKETDMVGHHYDILPFGAGRRICPGLPLAVSMLGLTLANLIHCFDLQLPHGQSSDTMNMEERKGVTSNKAVPTAIVPKPRFPMDFLYPTSA